MITHAPAAFTLCFVSRCHQYAADLDAAAAAVAATAGAAVAVGQPAVFATSHVDCNKSPLGKPHLKGSLV